MRCFHASRIGAPGEVAELDAAELHHLFTVFRAAPGDRVLLSDGRGTLAEATVQPRREVVVDAVQLCPPPSLRLSLYLCPPRKKLMDQTLKQCAEVGVWAVRPVFCERSVALPEGEGSLEHWRTELLEGCKQSKNPFVPQVFPPVKLSQALAGLSGLLCYGAATGLRPKELRADGAEIALFVGPEGGFSDGELGLMAAAGAVPVSFGAWTMRVETAAVVGSAMLLNELR